MSAEYRAQSWGRTRSPKNLADPREPGKPITALTNTGRLKGITAAIDRVAFVNGDPDEVVIFAACSTF